MKKIVWLCTMVFVLVAIAGCGSSTTPQKSEVIVTPPAVNVSTPAVIVSPPAVVVAPPARPNIEVNVTAPPARK